MGSPDSGNKSENGTAELPAADQNHDTTCGGEAEGTPGDASHPSQLESESKVKENVKWPGWPGDNVFRLIVPVLKVGSIIGRKGELIKKMCEETRARIRILEGPLGMADRIVLISGKEEPEEEISPAMSAVLRVFKHINGIAKDGIDGTGSASTGVCSVRLLVASSQAINLIGKQGSQIKTIQENTGASIRVLTGAELPAYVKSDERILEVQGESLKVLKALQACVGHLRKFLVDHSVVPLFEKTQTTSVSQDQTVETWSDKPQSLIQTSLPIGSSNDYPLSFKRDSLFLDRELQMEQPIKRAATGLSSAYRHEPLSSTLHPSGLGRNPAALVTQVTQTMQIPMSYAEDIIGVGGTNIAYIRRTSGAILTIQETRGMPDEITVEIKGTSTQVQTAQQLIQESMAEHKEPPPSSYGKLDTGLRSYSHLGSTSYPSSFASHTLGGYGSSGAGGYGSYRL